MKLKFNIVNLKNNFFLKSKEITFHLGKFFTVPKSIKKKFISLYIKKKKNNYLYGLKSYFPLV